MKTITERVSELRRGLDRFGVFDINGKNFKSEYVKNLEVRTIKLEDTVSKLNAELNTYKQGWNPVKCKGCRDYNNGTHHPSCKSCRRYCADLYKEK